MGPCEREASLARLRSAARRALTRGRWRPLKQFAEASLFIKETMDSPDAVPAASIELYKAAWALEPGQVFVVLTSWHDLHVNNVKLHVLTLLGPLLVSLQSWSRQSMASRIMAACEDAYSKCTRASMWAYGITYSDGRPKGRDTGVSTWDLEVGSPLESWCRSATVSRSTANFFGVSYRRTRSHRLNSGFAGTCRGTGATALRRPPSSRSSRRSRRTSATI